MMDARHRLVRRWLVGLTGILLAACPMLALAQLSQWHAETAVSPRTGPLTYLRWAMDASGERLEFAQAPTRIVSLEYEMDEYVYRIAPTERVVGVSAQAYREQVSNVLEPVKRYQPAVATSIEVILRLKPDLVLASNRSNGDLIHLIQSAGIPVFRVHTLVTTLDQVAENISLIGYVTGCDEAAAAERARFTREIEAIRTQCRAHEKPPRVFGVSMVGYTYGDQTLFHDVVRLVGGVNIGAENGLRTYQKVGRETILRWNPEWIFTWSDPGQGAQELQNWLVDPVVGATEAAQKQQVVVSDGKDHLPLSPLVTRLARTMAHHLCNTAPNP